MVKIYSSFHIYYFFVTQSEQRSSRKFVFSVQLWFTTFTLYPLLGWNISLFLQLLTIFSVTWLRHFYKISCPFCWTVVRHAPWWLLLPESGVNFNFDKYRKVAFFKTSFHTVAKVVTRVSVKVFRAQNLFEEATFKTKYFL